MIQSVSTMLVTAAGDPIPPQSVVQYLRTRPHLKLEWMGGVGKYWRLRERWRPGDRRWESVQTGRIPESEAFDHVMAFPQDCTGDDMAAFIERHTGERVLSRADAAKEAERIVESRRSHNERQMESNIQRVHEDSVERHERESRHDLRVRAGVEKASPMVTVL